MSIRFTNQQLNTKDQAIVLVVTHSKPFTVGEALAAAIVESAFGRTTIQRQKEGHQRFVDDPNVITINLVDVSDVERRNIGRRSTKDRNGIVYTTASLTWYSFASILLANVGISGEHTQELIEDVDKGFFLPLDQYGRCPQWWWPFVRGAAHGRALSNRLKGSILGGDDLCFRHAIEGAKIVLHQQISGAVQGMQARLEHDPRYVDEQEFRSIAKRPVFLIARPVQCLGQKVFYAREDLEEVAEEEKRAPLPKDSVPRSEIAKEVERIIRERFRRADLSPQEQAIADYASERFKDEWGSDPRENSAALARIQVAARRAQEVLSRGEAEGASISLCTLDGGHNMEVSITQDVWERLRSSSS